MLWTTFDFRPVNAWEKRKLGSIGKIKSGSGFPSIEQGGKQGIPFYKVSDMNTSGNKNSMVISQNYVTSAQLKKRKWTPITNTPAIIFAKVGAAIFLDRKRVVEHPFLIDNNMMAYIVGDAWNLRFCQAFFQSIPLLKFAQTGALPSLNAHDIGRIPVHLPTRYEQKEIGDLIYKVTRLIAATQDKLDCLERVKKALLQHLFDQSMRFKGYSDPWEKRKLGNISEIRTGPFGSVLHAKDYVDDGVPIITTEHFKSGALPTCKFNLPQVSAEDFRRLKSYNLQPGDVVFSRVGSVDVSAEVLPLQDGWLFSGRVLRVRPKESVSGAFLHYVLSTTLIKRNIRSRAVGQTLPSINTKILNDTSIVLPHKTSEQNKISSALANLDSLIAATQSKLSSLESLKKALLQGLFI